MTGNSIAWGIVFAMLLITLPGCGGTSAERLKSEAAEARKNGDSQKALDLYSKAIQHLPNSAALLAERGEHLASIGDSEHALADFEAAIAHDPKVAAAWRGRARLRQTAGQIEPAIDDYAHVIQLEPHDAVSLAQRGVCLAKLGRHAEAIADLDAALKLNARMASVYQARGLSSLTIGNAAAAANDFHQADLLQAPLPEHASLWCQALIAQEKFAEAEKIADRALKQTPSNAELAFLRGHVRLTGRKYAEAIADFDQVLKLAPDRIDTLLARAAAKNGAKQYAAARADLSKFLEQKPNHPQALRERARVALLLNDPDAAWADADLWLKEGDKSAVGEWARMLTYRALAAYRLGDWPAAEKDAAAAVEADPERHDARCVLAFARLLGGGKIVGDRDSVVTGLTELIAAHPNDVRLLNLRAIAYLLHGDASLALADCDLAERVVKDGTSEFSCRSAVMLRQQRMADAINVWKQAPTQELIAGYSARRIPELLAKQIKPDEELPGWKMLLAGKWGLAVVQSSAAIAKQSDDPRLLLIRAAGSIGLGDTQAALADEQQAVGLVMADNAWGHHLRALVAIEKGDYPLAATESLAGLRLAPDDAALYATHLVACIGMADWQAVQIDADIAAALDANALLVTVPLHGVWSRPSKDPAATPLPIELEIPPSLAVRAKSDASAGPNTAGRETAAVILSQAGQNYYLVGKYQPALERYDLALRLTPRPEWFAGRAAVNYSLKNFQAAVDDFTKAIEAQPGLAAYHFNRANAWMSLQNFDQAMADYTRAIELDPDNSEAYRHRSKLHALRKDDARAQADVERARKLRIEGK